MSILAILCILQIIYISNGAEVCRCGDTGDEHVTAGLCDYCKSSSCIDLFEIPAHHHIMSLTADDPTVAFVEHTADHRSWICTCSDCDGLEGTWNCPGFYGTAINIVSDTADVMESYTTTRSDAQSSSYVCLTPDDPCDAVDIDGFLRGCSAEFASTNSVVGELSTKIDDNLGHINTNIAGIAANLGNIGTNTAGISDNLDQIDINTAHIASLADDVAAIRTFDAAHNGVSVVDNGIGVVDEAKNNYVLLLSLLTNVFVIIFACFLAKKVVEQKEYRKVSYVESDTEQPLNR